MMKKIPHQYEIPIGGGKFQLRDWLSLGLIFVSAIVLSILFALAVSRPAKASQNTTTLPTVGPYPGLTMLFNINSALNSLQTNFSGAACSGVTSPQTFQFCFDTTAHALRIYDGSAWQPIGNLAGSQWAAISNGVPLTIPSSTGSSNAYVVTYASVPTAYVTGQHYPFIANFANTSAATLNVNSLGAKSLKKQGGVALGSADIGSGAVVDTVYDGTNLQMLSQTGNSASGSVTSVGCGTGLSGGTITTSGTCALATILTNQVLANPTGGTAVPIGTSLSALIDAAIGSTQGDIIYRNGSIWTVLPPGTNGQALTTGGIAANPSWSTTSSSGVGGRSIFTSSGTWTKPAGVGANSVVYVECIGGGGGGGASGGFGGGQGGGYVYNLFAASALTSTVTVTIGGGGASSGFDGGNTTFGSYLTAGGGASSAVGPYVNGIESGGAGSSGGNGSTAYHAGGGGGGDSGGLIGGTSMFGGAGGGFLTAGTAPGGGGGGGGSSIAGAHGQCIVTTWL